MVSFRPKWSIAQVGKRNFKFRYIDDDFNGSTTAMVPQSLNAFRGNGMYDPDATGFGVSPYFYDQFINATMYSSWTVFASKITIYPRIHSAPGYQKVILYPTVTNMALTNTDPSDLMNMRGSQAIVIDGTSVGSRDRGRKLQHYMSTRKMFPNFAGLSTGLAGTYNTDPGTMWYWHVVFDQTHDGINDIETTYDVKIVYYAVLRGTSMNVNES